MLRLVRQGRWDIVLLDITMHGRSALDALKELRQEYPRLPVLVLSIHPEDQFAVLALKAGACGYMTKESAPEEFVGAIRRLLRGQRYLSRSLAEKLAFGLGDGGRDERPEEALSDPDTSIRIDCQPRKA